MGRGRKRKAGKREPNGRLKRASKAVAIFDKGSERTQAMHEIYGTDDCDAIGRAYRFGLLGEGQDAKAMLDTARKISNAYWAAYEVGKLGSPIGEKTGGGTVPEFAHERALQREEWLSGCMGSVSALGRAHRRAFDQLAVDINPDYGPSWLDAILARQETLADKASLTLALEALAMLAAVEIPGARKKAA